MITERPNMKNRPEPEPPISGGKRFDLGGEIKQRAEEAIHESNNDNKYHVDPIEGGGHSSGDKSKFRPPVKKGLFNRKKHGSGHRIEDPNWTGLASTPAGDPDWRGPKGEKSNY